MRSHQTIQKFTAALLLLVFALSVTPKKLLHNAFANHKDSVYKEASDGSNRQQLQTSSINCGCDNLVVISPFISDAVNFESVISSLYPQPLIQATTHFTSSVSISFGLRGPPAKI